MYVWMRVFVFVFVFVCVMCVCVCCACVSVCACVGALFVLFDASAMTCREQVWVEVGSAFANFGIYYGTSQCVFFVPLRLFVLSSE